MKTTSRRRQEAHVRTQAVCADHRGTFEATSVGKKMLAQLDTSVADVEHGFAEQQGGLEDARRGGEDRRTSRRGLRGGITAVVRISHLVGLDAGTSALVQMPTLGSDELLAADARMILDKVTPLADPFAAQGLPANVLADLPGQIAALKQAKLAQAAGKERHLTANAAILTALDSGDEAVAALEKILVASQQDPDAMTAWNCAKRVGPSRAKEAAVVVPMPAPEPRSRRAKTEAPHVRG